MLNLWLPSFFLALFGFFNLLGINSSIASSQLFNIGMASVIFFTVKKIGRKFFQINGGFFYWFFTIGLVVTYIIGAEIKGSKRWLDLYYFNFQASEFFKIFFIIFLANLLSKLKHDDKLTVFVKACGFFILPTLIIFKQPDLGNALVFVFIFFVMIIFSDLPKKYILLMLLLFIVCGPVFWLFLKEYQKMRLISFVSPHLDNQGTAYNIIQAIITTGSGKLFGRGLGLGTQARLFFLPENHTDFAFSSLVEQFGFVGGLVVILLYVTISIALTKRVVKYFYQRGRDGYFNFLYTLGFLVFFLTQVFVNLGMNLGILPVAGIALPLISYGGSSVVTWMLGLALLP